MAWVVDTSVVIDIVENDSVFGLRSARTVDRCQPDGLVICPVTYAELAPTFQGQKAFLEEFLGAVGIEFAEPWLQQDTERAFAAWNSHVQRRRKGEGHRRPIADLLIAAFASRFQGIVTRNSKDFEKHFPDLLVINPTAA